MRRFHCPRLAGGSPEHHRDQPFAVAGRGGDQIVAGGTDEAGLETVGAGVASDQLVEILRDPAAEADRGNVDEIFVFRQIANDAAGEDRKIAGRSDLTLRGQAIRIDIVRLRHPEPVRGLIHLSRKTIDRTSDALGEHHGHVVGRFHQHHLQRVIDGDLDPRPETHLGWRLRRRDRRYRQQGIQRDASVLDGLQRDIGRHQLGDRCGIPGIGGVLRLQHLSATTASAAARTGQTNDDLRNNG